MNETLQLKIQRMAQVLDSMTREEQRGLETSLSRLSPKLIAIVCEALHRERNEHRLPAHELSFLERTFEAWWAHSLATKMAALAVIHGLLDSAFYPAIQATEQCGKCLAGVDIERTSSAIA